MKTKIGENIKLYRKEKNFTQEQLSEAMGVTVGAVSKWESGASVPDISIIMELADFFEVSVDALLGFEMRQNSAAKSAERISNLEKNKEYDEGIIEAEKALQKYPNNFEVVYQSAHLYLAIGVRESKYIPRAQELFERSLTLIDQNTDEEIDRITITRYIAQTYFIEEKTEEGIELLKKNNFDGHFDYNIGYILSSVLHRFDESLTFLSDALIGSVSEIYGVAISYCNLYSNRGEFDSALEVLRWAISVNEGLKIPGKSSLLDRSTLIMLASAAEVSALKLDETGVNFYLQKAKALAEEFNKDPDYSAKNVKFYFKDKPATSSDGLNQDAVKAIDELVEIPGFDTEDHKARELLQKVWKEINENG